MDHQHTSRSFKNLECWQQAHEFVKAVYAATSSFPDEERFGLTSQFRRAAVSIAAKPTHDNLEHLINGTSWKLNGYAEAINHNKGIPKD